MVDVMPAVALVLAVGGGTVSSAVFAASPTVAGFENTMA
ncbi:MAG: hypothetical protein RLZZ612_2135, partial [Pseudomonadota bacterium]